MFEMLNLSITSVTAGVYTEDPKVLAFGQLLMRKLSILHTYTANPTKPTTMVTQPRLLWLQLCGLSGSSDPSQSS